LKKRRKWQEETRTRVEQKIPARMDSHRIPEEEEGEPRRNRLLKKQLEQGSSLRRSDPAVKDRWWH
uniref:Uncharacterized protein n=1 Tax=Triticum urartu TaxID=4572 RepID=A0A8R7PLQ0_TRIUA